MSKLATAEKLPSDGDAARKVDAATLDRQKNEVERYRRYIREVNHSTETDMERSLALATR